MDAKYVLVSVRFDYNVISSKYTSSLAAGARRAGGRTKVVCVTRALTHVFVMLHSMRTTKCNVCASCCGCACECDGADEHKLTVATLHAD